MSLFVEVVAVFVVFAFSSSSRPSRSSCSPFSVIVVFVVFALLALFALFIVGQSFTFANLGQFYLFFYLFFRGPSECGLVRRKVPPSS